MKNKDEKWSGISINVTESDKRMIRKKAGEDGISMSEYVRTCVDYSLMRAERERAKESFREIFSSQDDEVS